MEPQIIQAEWENFYTTRNNLIINEICDNFTKQQIVNASITDSGSRAEAIAHSVLESYTRDDIWRDIFERVWGFEGRV